MDIYRLGNILAVNSVFQALATTSRRQLLEALRRGERSVGELVELTGQSQPAVSKQLRVLRDLGVVSLHPAGRQHLYSVRREPLREACDWLSYYLRYWSEGLTRLDQTLEGDIPPRGRKKG